MVSIEDDLNRIKEIIAKCEEKNYPCLVGISELGFNKINNDSPYNPRVITSSEYIKKYSDGEIIIKEQSIDRCKTFVVRPDGVRVELIVKRNDNSEQKETFGWREKAHPGELDE